MVDAVIVSTARTDIGPGSDPGFPREARTQLRQGNL